MKLKILTTKRKILVMTKKLNLLWLVRFSYKIVRLTDPQIKVGDQVKEGDIIGYIEAMKVMNEITSDVSGEVTEIVVEHGTNVEYDQVLVKVK